MLELKRLPEKHTLKNWPPKQTKEHKYEYKQEGGRDRGGTNNNKCKWRHSH